jgi:hypothetical protein
MNQTPLKQNKGHHLLPLTAAIVELIIPKSVYVQNMPKRTANTIASRPTKRINAKIKAEIIFVTR